MAPWEITLRMAAGVVLTALNAIFVTTEFALTRAPSLGADAFKGKRSLELAWKMTNELEIYLTGCQLGISSTSILLGIVTEPAMTELIRPVVGFMGITGPSLKVMSVVVAVVLINLIHKVWGEQAPTYFGVEVPLRAARIGAHFLYGWTKVMYPLVIAGDGLAKLTLRMVGVRVTRSWTEEVDDAEGGQEDDLEGSPRAQLLRALARPDIDAERQQEVLAAYDMAETAVRDIMVPRSQLVFLRTDRALSDNLDLVTAHPKSRYPLCDGDLGRVTGVIYTKALAANMRALLEGQCRLRDLAKTPVFVEPDLPIDRLVDQLQRSKHELALVREEGRVVGLATQTDAFEHVVGSLQDPHDTAEVPRAANT